MNDCIFCTIIAGEIPASVVCEDELTVAFMDVRPIAVGHVLVVPRRHAPYLADLREDEAARMMVVGRRIACGLRACGLPCEGVNLFLNDGRVAGQEVFHSHLHVFPRFQGDRFSVHAPRRREPSPEREQLDKIARSIAGALPC